MRPIEIDIRSTVVQTQPLAPRNDTVLAMLASQPHLSEKYNEQRKHKKKKDFNLAATMSVARRWNEVLLEAIRNDYARPNVHARNLFHVSIALYDAWAIYDQEAAPYLTGNTVHNFSSSLRDFTPLEGPKPSAEKAMSYAAYRLLMHRFKNSPGRIDSEARFTALMIDLGYELSNTSTNYESGDAAALGNYIASVLIEFGQQDGAREQFDYDYAYYQPVNPPLDLNLPGVGPDPIDPNRWQPLQFSTFIDQSGNFIPGGTPRFLGPEWGNVAPFALRDDQKTVETRNGHSYTMYHDPGQPPQLNEGTKTPSSEAYQWNFSLVAAWSAHLDPNDGVLWDISPRSLGNYDIDQMSSDFTAIPTYYKELEGGDFGEGHVLNPITQLPYEPQLVPRGDYTRVLAEFWADGPDSETPPGHWFTLLNYVSDHPLTTKKFNGIGEELDPLEWDVKAYFILGGAMHDAAISAWGIKGWYDYIRPISAIRYMSALGQSTDQSLANYHPGGIPLKEGLVEVVEAGDPLRGLINENVGKIKVMAWRGHKFINDATTDVAGVGWILAENWWPYQRPSFVTPPFAGYVSGHSTYSRAAAEVLTLITGDEYFPGGMGEFIAKKDDFLAFEKGPSVDVVLQWATYRDASDQTSLSRIWGGIHPPADDIPGRIIGEQIGIDAYTYALPYFSSKANLTANDVIIYPNPVVDGQVHIKNSSANFAMSMTDLLGRMIAIECTYEAASYTTTISLPAAITPGLYVLNVNDIAKLVVVGE